MTTEQSLPKKALFSFDFLPARTAAMEYLTAGFLTVLWVAALLTYGVGFFGFFSSSPGQQEAQFLDVILYLCALFMPLMFLWLGAYMVVKTRQMHDDAQRLKASVETLRNAVSLNSPATSGEVVQAISEATASAMRAEQSRITTQFRNLSEQQNKIETAVRTLLKARGQDQQAISQLVETAQDVARKAESNDKRDTKLSKMTFDAVHDADGQENLPFEALENRVSSNVEWPDLIRALNFPEDEGDRDGFDAIKRVLPNHHVAQLLQASEDVLSMLAQEGIYMDDLSTDPANPDLWHRFTRGARGEEISEMGSIVDQAALALARGRTRADNIFKDASLHFLRLFDRFLQEFLDEATDTEVEELAETRTGRAFQLLARVSGTFD